ncbi:MAG: cytochrome c3 family protein [Sphingomonadales bacterium]|nr:cytochrome c3 family protein [Sphingomonadales bacterium]MBD3772717.1 cytochrome c3 family protein [Paracoccaceae bacterium]
MAFLIETIDITDSGREIVRKKELAADALTIGRDAASDIHLDDLAVELHHARIEPHVGGQLQVVAETSLGFGLEGRSTTSAVIDPKAGAELEIGSYRLTVSQDAGEPPTISIRKADEKEGARLDKVAGFSLGEVMPSKRLVGWAALIAILVAFLAIPAYTFATRDRVAKPDIKQPGQVVMDASWSTGKLSLAHHGLEDNCEACHVKAFEPVTDKTCLTCHEDVHDHADPARMDKGRGPLSPGDELQWKIAHAFGKPGPGACSDCHTEHEGMTKMLPPSQRFCADCHSSLDTRLTDTTLGNASDFGTAHPQFKAVVFTEPGQKEPQRISLDKHPRQFSGLRFPHELHLNPRGGVARMAGNIGAKAGYGGDGLECKDCHRLNKDKSSFLPVEMERDCEACHSLVYDKVGDTFRSLRHGKVDEMRADLAAMDRSPRRPIVTGRRRPGEFAQGGLYYQDFGRPAPSLVGISRALSRDGICGECHYPTTKNGRADVLPVRFSQRYFTNGWFDHEDHIAIQKGKKAECTDCHKADASKSSEDLLMPDLKICRDCHMGQYDTKADVPSGCAMCHSYHPSGSDMPAGHPQMAPRRSPRTRGKT